MSLPSTMPCRLISLLIVSLLSGAPALALPSLEELELGIQGEAKGWLNATCMYYGLGWLNEDDARQAMTQLTNLITAHHLGAAQAEQAKSEALQRDPGCQDIWPKTVK